jgi:hypothetical protein
LGLYIHAIYSRAFYYYLIIIFCHQVSTIPPIAVLDAFS